MTAIKLLLATALASAAGLVTAHAQDYPNRPITLIVVTAPGGGNDVIGRVLAERMGRNLGQQIVVENRPGAGGTLGTRQLARSEPDGYTLAIGNTGTLTQAPAVYPNAGYDVRKDFAPIGLIADAPLVMAINASVPAKSIGDIIGLAKQDPGKLTYASGGAGTPSHLTGELFGLMGGVKLTHVPFRGTGPAMTDLIAGRVTMIFAGLPATIGSIRAGTMRALAMTSVKRVRALPDVPTIAEAGLAEFEASQRYGLIAPAGTPPAIVAKLNAALREALKSDDVKARIETDGAEPMPSSPEEYARDIDREETKWSRVVRESGAQVKQ
jgi:tripartite-type tricarboxylate transporter receptor subunit TctC